MTGAAAGGKIGGIVRMPNTVCTYAKNRSGVLKGATISLGLVPANEDLAKKVGQKCS